MDGMMEKDRTEPAGSPQRSQEAGGGEPAGGPPQRFSAKRKLRAYNTHWLVARHRHRTPAQVRADQQPAMDRAA